MSECYSDGDFYKYFKENMDSLGAPAPESLFTSYTSAVATLITIKDGMAAVGSSATIAEIIGATTGLELLKVAASFGASAYAGILVGSLLVATQRSATCGSQIIDLFSFTTKHNLHFNGLTQLHAEYPEIFDPSHPNRVAFAARSKTLTLGFG